MKKIILLTFIVFGIFSCNKQNGYVINGKITGAEDSTAVFLADNNRQQIIDTAYIKSGKFKFSGEVEDISLFTLFFMEEGQQPLSSIIWVDNSKMNVSGDINEIEDLVITGSKVQEEYNEFNRLIIPLQARMDSLYNAMAPEDQLNEGAIQEVYEDIMGKQSQLQKDYIVSNPDYYFSLILVANLVNQLSNAESEELFSLLSEENKTSEIGITIKSYLEANQGLKVGDSYIDLSLKNINDELITLSDIADGKYVLIDFWASWCAPCREENPNLLKAYNKYKEKGFEIYGVSIDREIKDFENAIQQDGINWIAVIDTMAWESQAADIYKVNAIPHNFLINPEGQIISIDLRGKALEEKLIEIFKI